MSNSHIKQDSKNKMTKNRSKIQANLISGEKIKSSSNQSFKNYSPFNLKENLGVFPDSNYSDLEIAIQKAKITFKLWKQKPAPERGEILFKAAEITKKEKESLAKELSKETGKSKLESEGEIQEVIDTYLFFAGEGRRNYGLTGQSEFQDKLIITTREPIGICGLISAWNFPAAVPSWKIAPALVTGNVFILKPSEFAPNSAKLLIENLYKAGLPGGCAHLIFGKKEIGKQLVKHPEIKLISFTGSTQTGRKIYETCGRNLKKCALELGGKNPIIALKDADRKLLLEGLIWGAFGTAGQRCTSTSRLILEDSNWKESFIKDLKEKTESLEITPLINQEQADRVHAFVKQALKEGAELVTGGDYLKENFYRPTILRKVKTGSEISQKEVFGPVLSIIESNCSNLDQIIKIANDVEYGLSASVYTRDLNKALKVQREFEAGLVYVNAPTIGAECGGANAFGGWKNTGNGGSREGGVLALETYTQAKTLYIDYSDQLQRAQID